MKRSSAIISVFRGEMDLPGFVAFAEETKKKETAP